MKLIVGLGNPGKEYAGTRHNVGFDLVDALATAHKIKVDQRIAGIRALLGRGTIAGESVLLVKPQTFMNLSGEAVSALIRREAVPLSDLLVVSDDIHLPVGKLRLRSKGSSGGQNGLKSIATSLATQEWARVRIGVGEPPPGLQIDWVLGRFGKADQKLVEEMMIVAMGAVEVWLADGIETAMNRFNGDASP
ncbi:MAG: aminoacyl-tRNA hydrolase [Cytophagales bacterium]|nr:aminoacyl-tRNA hydrolase [Armatimonadota bacterium]